MYQPRTRQADVDTNSLDDRAETQTAGETALVTNEPARPDTTAQQQPTAGLPTSPRPLQPKPVLTIRVPAPPSKALPQLQRLPTLKQIPTRPSAAATARSAAQGDQRPTTSTTRPTTSTTRPATSATSNRPPSFASVTTVRRPIKYGRVHRGGSGQQNTVAIELVPQPSDDDDDPLNWPAWKKELGYWPLLLAAATTGVSKTALVSVGSQLATTYNVTYTAVAALTGVPLMVSALSGLAAVATTRVYGRRPAYLVSAVLLLLGVAWNAAVVLPGDGNYAQCMVARVLQGLSWGAFDTLVLGSIHDTYFEHQLPVRLAVFDIVVVGATWGGPLLGGVASSHGAGVAVQFDVLSMFATLVLLLVALGVPETLFDRSFYMINTPVSAASAAWSDKALPQRPRMTLSVETAADYLWTLRPWPYRRTAAVRGGNTNNSRSAPRVSTLLLQPVRAMVAPTTLLLVAATLLPVCMLWGLTLSLSLLFAPAPLVLSPASRGALMAAPWLLASVVVAVGSASRVWPQPWQTWRRRAAAGGLRFVQGVPVARGLLERLGGKTGSPGTSSFSTTSRSPLTVLALVAGGTLLSFVGLLAFGLYVSSGMSTGRAADIAYARLSFGAVSFVLGLLAAGAYVLDAAVRPMVRRSTQFTSTNLAVAQRNTADMCAGVGLWRTLGAGAFVIGMPSAVWAFNLLRTSSIGIAAAQLLATMIVVVVWCRRGEVVWRLDGRVMHCVDQVALKRAASFFGTA